MSIVSHKLSTRYAAWLWIWQQKMSMQKQSLTPALKKQQSKNSLTYDLTLKSLSKERQAYFEKLQPMIWPFK